MSLWPCLNLKINLYMKNQLQYFWDGPIFSTTIRFSFLNQKPSYGLGKNCLLGSIIYSTIIKIEIMHRLIISVIFT